MLRRTLRKSNRPLRPSPQDACLRAIARSVPIYDTQVTVAPGVFPLSTPHVDKSVHRGRVRPEVHGKTAPIGDRSEEHTSELQSLMRISYAVFCLKKKNRKHKTSPNTTTTTRDI